jgi:D-amino-acid oxidase
VEPAASLLVTVLWTAAQVDKAVEYLSFGRRSAPAISPLTLLSTGATSMSAVSKRSVIVLGAGVAGLTTASTLLARYPSTLDITIIAKHLPGDTCPAEYCSPQAGANWHSFETEVNQYAQYDRATFERFLEIAVQNPESGVKRFPLRLVYGNETAKAKMWFHELVGGIKNVPKHELPQGAGWGVDLVTFMYNPSIYLNW